MCLSFSFPIPASIRVILLAAAVLAAGCAGGNALSDPDSGYARSYAVVVSKDTYAQAEWKAVADALVLKHAAELVVHSGLVTQSREALSALMPRYTAFVARPEECGRDYIAAVHRLTRRLDSDPWLDTQWGVITGSDAASALRITQVDAPLVVRKGLSTTGLNPELFDEFFLIRDGNPPGNWIWKKPGAAETKGSGHQGKSDADAWAEHFESGPDLIVSSAHGYENGLEMPFSRGIIRVVDGKLYPLSDVRMRRPSEGATPIAETGNPKVYFPVGNCLIGHVNSPHCMVTTMMGAHGVRQMAGYTVNTWFGRGGWDMLGLWQVLAGRNTFSESFFFNQQWMLHDIAALDPKALDYEIALGSGEVDISGHVRGMIAAGLRFDPRNMMRGGDKSPDRQLVGLLWDIDTVAFYGDPAWRTVLDAAKTQPFLETSLVSSGNKHTLTVKILDATAAAGNNTPVGVIFSTRLKNIALLSGEDYKPIVADNFILVLKPQPKKGETEFTVEFTGEPIEVLPRSKAVKD
ncbi:MAG: hypothetical protein LBV54_06030 [Puniceicoccales bacterium]|jgi:zinc protease|nr:hypothetical protein [Puniceicoccales bacterium]